MEETKTTQTIEIPEGFKYVLDRGEFEYRRAISNAAFMLDKNLDNIDYLETDLHKRLQNRAEETFLQRELYMLGVLSNILNTNNDIPIEFEFSENNKEVKIIRK